MPGNHTLRHMTWLLSGLAMLFILVWQAPALYTVEGLASYLPVHIFAETFSIVISMLVFGVVWNAYSKERPSNIVILACALFAVGLIDFAHMLSFKGMTDFITPSGPEKAINLWLAGRLLAALALFAVALRPWQPFPNPQARYWLLAGSIFVTALVIWAGLAYPQVWPRTFIAGHLTPFKIGAEYTIIAILLVPMVLFYRQAKRQQSDDVRGLFAATVVTILSELSFTLYSDVADVFNLLGHLYKIVAYAFIYRAVFVVSVRDPFQRLRAEFAENRRIAQELRTASLYTRSLVEASLDPLVTISAEGKITDVNQATEKVTGYGRAELIGTDFSDYFTEPDKARVGYQQAFRKGAITDYSLALRHRDGHVTDVLYNASVYRNEAGEVLGVFAAARDITERKRAEAIRTQLAAIVESSNDAIIGKTPEGIITSWNKSAETIYGYTAAEVIGKPITILAQPSRHDEIRSILEKVRKGEIVANHETERVRKDGAMIQVALTLSPIRDAFGNIAGISTIARDITERKLAEEQLRRNAHSLSEAQRIAHLGNWELDLVSNVLTWSDEIYRIFEIDPEKFDASYEAFLNAIHPDDRERVNKAYSDSVANKVPYDIVHRLQMQDGRIKYVNEKCETHYAEDGKPLRSVGTVHDITERKLDEEALRRLNRELRAISNCNQTLMRAEDEQALLGDICRIVCEDAGYRMAWVGYPENDADKTIRHVAWAGIEDGYLEQAKLTWADAERGQGPSGIAIRSGESASIQDFATAPQVIPWRDAALQRGYRSSISLPLKDENAKIFGIFNIYAATPNAFTPEEIRLLEELAGDMAFGIRVLRARIERQQAEGALRESEEKYRTLIQKIRAAVVVHGADTQILTSNSMAQELLGLSEDQLLGKMAIDPAWHFFREDGTAAALDEYPVNRVLASRKALRNFVLGVHRPNLENDVWVLVNADPVFGKEDEIAQVIVTFIDITERKRIESALAQREYEYRTLAENSPDVIVRYDREGRRIYVNPEFERVNRLTAQQVLGKTPAELSTELLPKADEFTEKLMEAMESGTVTKIDLAWSKEGRPVCWFVRVVPEFDAAGKVTSALTIWSDISERKIAEEEIHKLNVELEQRVQDRTRQLAASEERMRQFFERQLVGMAITSPEKGWVQVNDKICEMLGYSREELTRLSWAEMTHPEDLAPDVVQFERMLRGEIDSYMLEKRFIRKDGSIVFTNLAVGCVRRADRSVDYVLALLEDISERKHAEESVRELNLELQQRAKELEDANKELESFSYSVSHDLRTPLRAIDGFSRILLDDYPDKLDAEGKRLLNVVRDNTRRMGQLIDDILKFSRAGRVEITLSAIDMERMAHAVFEELQPEVDESKLQLEIEHLPPTQGDNAMMHQVFVNLLSNALKFSRHRDPARIKVGSYLKGEDVVYYVQDNGAGFDMNYADKLFGVFQRLHGVTEFEGTGIGLAIVKRIVTRHGGRVWAEGKVNEGATLYFALPTKERAHG